MHLLLPLLPLLAVAGGLSVLLALCLGALMGAARRVEGRGERPGEPACPEELSLLRSGDLVAPDELGTAAPLPLPT